MKFIVNLTSFDKRLESTAPMAISSLLHQTEKPDRIILWLSHGTKINSTLGTLLKNGLEIQFCEDFKSYTKLIPALLKYPKDVLITADDDVYYPSNWFASLKASYLANPSRIHVNRAHEMVIDDNGELEGYKNWNFCVTGLVKEESIFPTGVGGILYPPKSLHSDVLKSSIFLSLAPKGDDIWFWAMARLQRTKYKILEDGYKDLDKIDSSDNGMWIENVYKGRNDMQFIAVLEKYPKLITLLQKIL